MKDSKLTLTQKFSPKDVKIKEGDKVVHTIFGECTVIKFKERGDDLFIRKYTESGGFGPDSKLELCIDQIETVIVSREIKWIKAEENLPPICEETTSINLLKHLVIVKQSNGNVFTATNFNNTLWYNPNNQLYYHNSGTEWMEIYN